MPEYAALFYLAPVALIFIGVIVVTAIQLLLDHLKGK